MAQALTPVPYRVVSVHREVQDVVTLDLVPENGAGVVPEFRPGQFNMLYQFGSGEVPISISGSPESRDMITHTLRAVGAVTEGLCRCMPGDCVGLRGPFGTAWPLTEARDKHLLMIAGGLGSAPLRPVLHHAAAHRTDFLSLTFICGSRTPGLALYASEFAGWSDLGIRILPTVDQATPAWRGEVGAPTALIPRALEEPGRTLVMTCGPEVMMRFVIGALLQQGIAGKDIYLSLERNMQCAVGLCGHCQFGPHFVCKDGPVFAYPQVASLLARREV